MLRLDFSWSSHVRIFEARFSDIFRQSIDRRILLREVDPRRYESLSPALRLRPFNQSNPRSDDLDKDDIVAGQPDARIPL